MFWTVLCMCHKPLSENARAFSVININEVIQLYKSGWSNFYIRHYIIGSDWTSTDMIANVWTLVNGVVRLYKCWRQRVLPGFRILVTNRQCKWVGFARSLVDVSPWQCVSVMWHTGAAVATLMVYKLYRFRENDEIRVYIFAWNGSAKVSTSVICVGVRFGRRSALSLTMIEELCLLSWSYVRCHCTDRLDFVSYFGLVTNM